MSKHRMYCAKSGVSCLVLHPDGICPDVRDCEGCKAEAQQPKAAPTNNQNSLDELKRDLVIELSNAYYETYRYDHPNDTVEQLQAFCRDLAENDVDELLAAQQAAINKTIIECLPEKQNGCDLFHSNQLPSDTCSNGECLWKSTYNQAISDMEQALTEKYGRADNEGA